MKKTERKAGRHLGTIPAAASGFSFARLRHFIRATVGLSAIILVGSWTNTLAAQDQHDQHQFAFCPGNYALCSASTCTPTGNKIQVNGATQLFPEANCTCPVFSGVAIADLI